LGGKEGRGAGGRNDPNIVCTYEYNLKKNFLKQKEPCTDAFSGRSYKYLRKELN
jgi:hypothetical protein